MQKIYLMAKCLICLHKCIAYKGLSAKGSTASVIGLCPKQEPVMRHLKRKQCDQEFHRLLEGNACVFFKQSRHKSIAERKGQYRHVSVLFENHGSLTETAAQYTDLL